MKIGSLAMLLTCALISAAGAATVTMTPPDLEKKQATKPSVQAPPNVQVQPQVQLQPRPTIRTEPLPELASPRAIEAKPKVLATPSAPAAQTKPQATAKTKVVATPLPRVMEAKPKVIAAPSATAAQPKTQTASAPKVAATPSIRTAQPQTKFQNRLVQRDVHRRRLAHRALRRYAGSYHYAAAAPVRWRQWVPNDGGPIASPEVEGLRIEDRGWTGGVGYAPDGGGGFVDGYGQLHFANGSENGPSYNSYGQSFQSNPSQAGPFQPRLMGGFAPPSR